MPNPITQIVASEPSSFAQMAKPVAMSDAQLVEALHAHHSAAEQAATTALSRALDAGDVLIEAKRRCRHGEWGGWLDKHFSGSSRTARQYMQLASNRDEIESKMAGSAVLSIQGAVQSMASPARTSTRSSSTAIADSDDDELQLCRLVVSETVASVVLVRSWEVAEYATDCGVDPFLLELTQLVIDQRPDLGDSLRDGRCRLWQALAEIYRPGKFQALTGGAA